MPIAYNFFLTNTEYPILQEARMYDHHFVDKRQVGRRHILLSVTPKCTIITSPQTPFPSLIGSIMAHVQEVARQPGLNGVWMWLGGSLEEGLNGSWLCSIISHAVDPSSVQNLRFCLCGSSGWGWLLWHISFPFIFFQYYQLHHRILSSCPPSQPIGTPYAFVLFFFDVFFPPNYPDSPPEVHGIRTNGPGLCFVICNPNVSNAPTGVLGYPALTHMCDNQASLDERRSNKLFHFGISLTV